MRIGIIGGGVIARLVLEHRAALGAVEVAGILGRSEASRGKPLAASFGVPFVTSLDALVALKPDAVIEAASHDAVRQYAAPLLEAGIPVIVLSGGALCDDALRTKLERLAAEKRALLYVPSGGIGGLDALKAACAAGVDEVEIAVTKPPVAWKDIPYVERLGVDLDRLAGATTLFDGSARDGVPHFPANVNIAAVLVDGRRRLRPDAAESGRRPGAEVQHPLHHDPRPDRDDQPQVRVGAFARQPEDGAARLLQRARGDQGVRRERPLRHLTAVRVTAGCRAK